MAKGRKAPGRPKGLPKYGGRKKGTPNKLTVDVRKAIASFAEGEAAEFARCWKRVARKNPGHAAEIYLRAIEYHIPKLSRTELTGSDGQALIPPTFGVTFPQGFPGVAAATTEPNAAGESTASD